MASDTITTIKQDVISPNAMFAKAETPAASKRRAPMTLDMGEGSREQGFRLNGCR